MDEMSLRNQVCQGAQQLWMRGLIAGDDGMVTAELNRRRYLTTPIGKRRADLLPEDLICVDMGGESVQGEHGVAPDRWLAHRLAYQQGLQAELDGARNGHVTRATVLATPPSVMALLQLQRMAQGIEVAGVGTLPVVDAQNESALQDAIQDTGALVLRDGGLLVAASSVAAALNHVERIELAANIQLAIRRQG